MKKTLLIFAIIITGIFFATGFIEKDVKHIKDIEMEQVVFNEGDSVEVLNNVELWEIWYEGGTLPAIAVGDTGVVLKRLDTNLTFVELSLINQFIAYDISCVIIDFRGIGKGVRVLPSFVHSHVKKL